jgi:hypothetical protein
MIGEINLNTKGCSNFSLQFMKKMQKRHAFYLLILFPCTEWKPQFLRKRVATFYFQCLRLYWMFV